MSTAVKEIRKPVKYDYHTSEYDKVLEPDDDFYRAISMDEAIIRVEEGMKKIVDKHRNIQTLQQ